MNRFPVLMFHRIVSEVCPVGDAGERRYAVRLAAFEAQLDAISARGQIGVSMERVHEHLLAGGTIPGEWVAITFDDGNRSDHEHVLPMLTERGFSATFYVCGNRIGSEGGLDRVMIAQMRAAGQHIGSHAMSHRFLTALSAQEEEDELRGSRDVLSEIIGETVDHFAPPGGRIGRRTFDALARLGYRAVTTSKFGYNAAAGKRDTYRRIPVLASTSLRRFNDILARGLVALLPAYARSIALDAVRGSLGERGYGLLRERALPK